MNVDARCLNAGITCIRKDKAERKKGWRRPERKKIINEREMRPPRPPSRQASLQTTMLPWLNYTCKHGVRADFLAVNGRDNTTREFVHGDVRETVCLWRQKTSRFMWTYSWTRFILTGRHVWQRLLVERSMLSLSCTTCEPDQSLMG